MEMEAVVVAEAAKDPAKAAGKAKETAALPENGAVAPPPRSRNRIQVSSSKKPVNFYVGLAKRIMQQHNEVVLSALGKAIVTVVRIAVILKNTGLATEKSILTSTVESMDETSGRNVQKAKIEILLGKTDNLGRLTSAAKVDHREKPAEQITETDGGTVPVNGTE